MPTLRVDVEVLPGVILTTVALRDNAGPCLTLGLIVAERVIVPLKPLMLVTVIVVDADAGLRMVREAGLAESLKVGGLLKVAPWGPTGKSETHSNPQGGVSVTRMQTLWGLQPY